MLGGSERAILSKTDGVEYTVSRITDFKMELLRAGFKLKARICMAVDKLRTIAYVDGDPILIKISCMVQCKVFLGTCMFTMGMTETSYVGS